MAFPIKWLFTVIWLDSSSAVKMASVLTIIGLNFDDEVVKRELLKGKEIDDVFADYGTTLIILKVSKPFIIGA